MDCMVWIQQHHVLVHKLKPNEINTVDHAITHTGSRDLVAWSIGSYIKRSETNKNAADHITSSKNKPHYLSKIKKVHFDKFFFVKTAQKLRALW